MPTMKLNIKDALKAALGHFQKGRLEQAEDRCAKILRIRPATFDALHLLGVIAYRKANYADSVNLINRALEIMPDHAEAYNNLGRALKAWGKGREAIASFEKALAIDPGYAEAYYNLGNIMKELRKGAEAARYYEKALAIIPGHVRALNNLGNVLRDAGKTREALECYRRSLSIDPQYHPARWGYCMAQIPVIYEKPEEIPVCRMRYTEELKRLDQLFSAANPAVLKAGAAAIGDSQPFYLPYQGENDRELQCLYGDIIHRMQAAAYPEWSRRLPMPPVKPGEPLRIGIVSAFFHNHSNWKMHIRGWLEAMDRSRFAFYGYHAGKQKDRETDAARRLCSCFTEDIHSFEKLCRIIRSHDLHVLIYPEVGMDPLTAKLASLRLAPIQCGSFGHPDTTGLPTMDYYLSSDLMEAPDAEAHYRERLVRLPNLSSYYLPLDIEALPLRRADLGMKTDGLLYFCAQSLFKYLPQYDEVFPRIAREVGNCQFVFIASPNSAYVTERFLKRLGRVFESHGLRSADHLVMLPRLTQEQYHTVNTLVDIYLDSIGWSGCNSTLEAIACDLPVVTIHGTLMRDRHSYAILKMMDITGTIVHSIDEYVDLAVRLGSDAGWRRDIAAAVAGNRHKVYRDAAAIAAFETFLEDAVAGYHEG